MKSVLCAIILICCSLLFCLISLKQCKNNKKAQPVITVLKNAQMTQLITDQGKKYGNFYLIKINKHRFIIYQDTNKFGLTHDPDCGCKEKIME